MSLFRRRLSVRGHDGFSLVEVLAALSVFAIVTLGVVPLLGAALRGTSLSRTETVAQNTARQMMERIQGLKWFTSWNAKQAKVDLLDLFYPRATGTGYSTVTSYSPLLIPNPPGYGAIFTTTCPDSTNPACGGVTLPEGYSMTVKSAFVKAKAGTTPQAYEIVNPATTYTYDSTTGADEPPSQLLDVNVVVDWTVNGRARAFQLRSIVGEHRYVAPGAVTTTASPSPSAGAAAGTVKMRATAKSDYVMQVQTGFSSSSAGTGCPTPPCASDYRATMGNAISTIQSGDTVSADTTVNTAKVSVTRAYPPPQVPPVDPPGDLAALSGVSRTVHAPPTVPAASYCLPAGGSPVCTAQQTLTHPDLSNASVGTLAGTRINSISADVPSGNPTTSSSWQSQAQFCSSSTPEIMAWNPHSDITTGNYLRLKTTSPFRSVWHANSSGCATDNKRLKGTTSATSTALTPVASRQVRATTTQGLAFLSILEFGYDNNNVVGPAWQFSDWTATVDCKATPNGGAYATASWTATMTYRFDNTNGTDTRGDSRNVLNPLLGIQVVVNSTGNDTLSGRFGGPSAPVTTVTTPDAFAWLDANNPLVYDGINASQDIYLMNQPSANKKGYFDDLSSNKNPITKVSADGRTVSASIDGAIRIDTNQLSSTSPDSAYNVSVGKLSCEAVDNR